MSHNTICPCSEQCPLQRAMDMIGGKWKLAILCSLGVDGKVRYNELKRKISGISNTMLAKSLRELEAHGLDHVMEPLTQKFIRKLHEILMTGTVDAYRQQVRPGEHRTVTSRPRDRELLPVSRINYSLTELIRNYEHQTEIERNQILDFHVRFEEIFPFEDGNGRVGRLIMFKECLRHDVMPERSHRTASRRL